MLERLKSWIRWGTIRCPYCHKKAMWAGVHEHGENTEVVGYVCVKDRKVFLFFKVFETDTPELRNIYTAEILREYAVE